MPGGGPRRGNWPGLNGCNRLYDRAVAVADGDAGARDSRAGLVDDDAGHGDRTLGARRCGGHEQGLGKKKQECEDGCVQTVE